MTKNRMDATIEVFELIGVDNASCGVYVKVDKVEFCPAHIDHDGNLVYLTVTNAEEVYFPYIDMAIAALRAFAKIK